MTCPACGHENREGARFCDACGTALPTADVAAPAETVDGGRYEIDRLIGEGSRKCVYLARDTRLDREVAVALVRTVGLDDAGRRRIDREARAMARLGDHPNIVTVFDVGDENGTPYIVSQYVGGGTLAELLAQRTRRCRSPTCSGLGSTSPRRSTTRTGPASSTAT